MNWGTDTKIQQTPQTEDVKHAINRGVRTRLPNPKWIEGLLEHPYHGVQRMAKNTENLLRTLVEVSERGYWKPSESQWQSLKDVFLEAKASME